MTRLDLPSLSPLCLSARQFSAICHLLACPAFKRSTCILGIVVPLRLAAKKKARESKAAHGKHKGSKEGGMRRTAPHFNDCTSAKRDPPCHCHFSSSFGLRCPKLNWPDRLCNPRRKVAVLRTKRLAEKRVMPVYNRATLK
jgi:hypothetical protein